MSNQPNNLKVQWSRFIFYKKTNQTQWRSNFKFT